MDVKVQNDNQMAIFAACEVVKSDKITSRKVSERVGWSHATCAQYVVDWSSQRAKKERDAAKKTQMSSKFVRALHDEVDDIIGRLRTVDAIGSRSS
ncbi:hypothetical protein J4N45_14555 [Vibrio sp. SCSIO 43140]|uniref:hypothetical protein n=1 Tax=Vibrio sp. SCSIO 43140 TaxID=2819100 RepID=UPI002075A1F9|nr:hypothetical protein [Vibrio sp. SCSIO 43140]USD58791.1 hypothetical protein J4N45_09630 [Vibrio sp. SCSIO 43140]USD59125.1 hypothetical protein J4N45_11335 [Vibrio sp. SCSIO 43140]USD59722.1 hypothetical protein J4N45_14555 [Vibrio sp. SCSIO 43140]